MDKKQNLIGLKFGRLTVIEEVRDEKNRLKVKCKCECGGETVTTTSCLISGHTKSCGCLKMESKNNKRNTYQLFDKYGICYMSNNQQFYFDIEDLPLIQNYYWSISTTGYAVSYYFTRDEDNKRIHHMRLFHRMIMNALDGMDVDHINRNRLDNRKMNLRLCLSQQNDYNNSLSKSNTSGVTGVSYNKQRKLWRAYISYQGKRIELGWYSNKLDAVLARLKAEKEYYKEFAPQKHLYKEYSVDNTK